MSWINLLVIFLSHGIALGHDEPTFANPQEYMCGSNKTIADKVRGYVMVYQAITKIPQKCILIRRWDSGTSGDFDFSSNTSSGYEGGQLLVVHHTQIENLILQYPWHLSPPKQTLVLLYSHSSASRCHHKAIPNQPYCYNMTTKRVSKCMDTEVDQGSMSVLYELPENTWTVYKIDRAIRQTNLTTAKMYPPYPSGSITKQNNSMIIESLAFNIDSFLHACAFTTIDTSAADSIIQSSNTIMLLNFASVFYLYFCLM